MTINVTCPHCTLDLRLHESFAGKAFSCSNCLKPFDVPKVVLPVVATTVPKANNTLFTTLAIEPRSSSTGSTDKYIRSRSKPKSFRALFVVGTFCATSTAVVLTGVALSANRESDRGATSTNGSNAIPSATISRSDYLSPKAIFANHEKYKGKTVRVKGQVDTIMRLEGGGVCVFVGDVSFMFRSRTSNGINVSALTEGTQVDIEGRCIGKMPAGHIELVDASLLEIDGQSLSRSVNTKRGITLADFLQVSRGMSQEQVEWIVEEKGLVKTQVTLDERAIPHQRVIVTYKAANGATAVFVFTSEAGRTSLIDATHNGLE